MWELCVYLREEHLGPNKYRKQGRGERLGEVRGPQSIVCGRGGHTEDSSFTHTDMKPQEKDAI